MSTLLMNEKKGKGGNKNRVRVGIRVRLISTYDV
jgi:hypothetical protein